MKQKFYLMSSRIIIIQILCISLFSCKDIVNVKPAGALEPGQYYRDVHDADAAVIGIYGQFMGLAKQYVLLNELRGDLMDVTNNADDNLKQLNYHTVKADNPYSDPRPFYALILNCNDVIKNFDIMKEQNKMLDDDYNQRYSDVVTIRSWLYFQLVLHYGAVPYVTQPFLKMEDLAKDLSHYPTLGIRDMVDQLLSSMEALPYKEIYSIDNALNTTIDTYNTYTFFINKKFFLGDLHLWKGNYNQAATYYRSIMETVAPGTGAFDCYKVKYGDVSTAHNDLAVGYVRFAEADVNSLINTNTQGWKSMFIRPQDALYNTEWIWALPFDSKFLPQTPFIDLFSNNGGNYLVKPSQAAIDNWNAQTQNNGFNWDARGIFTYQTQGGQPVIMKYIYNYDPLLPNTTKTGKWFISRAALLHLRFAEAANRDNQRKVAWALLNRGINYTFTPNPNAIPSNVTDIQQTLSLPDPYKFDARSSNGPPSYRGNWHRNNGLRGRAYLRDVVIPSSPTIQDSVINIENALINEAALELAYEGNRWSDLVRISLRRNDPSFLANRIYSKLQKAGYPQAAEVKARLMDQSNWFLPFKW